MIKLKLPLHSWDQDEANECSHTRIGQYMVENTLLHLISHVLGLLGELGPLDIS